jgi:hypothetical protein
VKRVSIALSILVVLGAVTAFVTVFYVDNSILGNSGSNASYSSSVSQLNCSSGYYQLNDQCVTDSYRPSATTTQSSGGSTTTYSGGGINTNSGGGCFGCVTITDLKMNVVNSNMPSECYIPSWDSGSLGEVIGPNENSPRTFTYEFHVDTAYGTQSDGTDCSNNDNVANLYIDDSNLIPISIQSVTPSLPYNVLNIGDQGGEENFVITFYVLQGNYYNGELTLTLQISGD